MEQNDKPVLVYATFPSVEAAQKTGSHLVEQRLAACVNIFPGMLSVYRWEGRISAETEAAMIIKTRRALADRVTAAVRAQHTYENPAILVLEVDGGAALYLTWIMAETSMQASAT